MAKQLLSAGFCIVAALISTSWAQDISAEEMMQLDKLRSQYEAQGIKVSPEQEARMLARIRALKGAMTSSQQSTLPGAALQQQILQATLNPMPGQNTANSALDSPQIVPEDEMKRRFISMPAGKPIAGVELLKDGFQYSGQRFADAEGRVDRFSLDILAGAVGYLIRGSSNAPQSVKIARLGDTNGTLTIGRVKRLGQQFQFESLSGKTLTGELLFPLTDGVLVMRDSVGFRYVVGEGVRQINIPKGWFPTPLQRGNLSSTGWFLLERDNEDEKKNPLNLLSGLSKAVGLTESNEYAVMSMSDGHMIELDISNSGKNVQTYSQCRRKNALVATCEQATSYESIWDPSGLRNQSHYYWRVDWQQTAAGPLMLVQEKGLKQVNAYDLTTGKKINLFERTLGISDFKAVLSPEGRWRVSAGMGFDRGNVEDVAEELSQRADARNAKPAIGVN